MTKLVNGQIPAKTVCPFRESCTFSMNSYCDHKGLDHEVAYSCGTAKGIAITGTAPDVLLDFIYSCKSENYDLDLVRWYNAHFFTPKTKSIYAIPVTVINNQCTSPKIAEYLDGYKLPTLYDLAIVAEKQETYPTMYEQKSATQLAIDLLLQSIFSAPIKSEYRSRKS